MNWFDTYTYIASRWGQFIDSQRSVIHLTATRVNKQYIREPHQSWYKSIIHRKLWIYIG